ncbi:MAG: hypothetical protein ACK4F9_05635 [Brevinematia bacterium]
MHITQIPYKLCLIFITITLSLQTIKANYLQITIGNSLIKNYIIVDSTFKGYGIFANIALERSDYGEIQNFSIQNPNYYQKTFSFSLIENSIPAKIGFYTENLTVFLSTRIDILTLTNQYINIHYGIGTILDIKENLSILSEIDNINILLNETKIKATLKYRDNFFKNLEISFQKQIIYHFTIEMLGEVRVLEINNFGLNLGAGYSLNFLGNNLYPYKILLRITLPNNFELLNTTKLSEAFIDTSISLIYNY